MQVLGGDAIMLELVFVNGAEVDSAFSEIKMSFCALGVVCHQVVHAYISASCCWGGGDATQGHLAPATVADP